MAVALESSVVSKVLLPEERRAPREEGAEADWIFLGYFLGEIPFLGSGSWCWVVGQGTAACLEVSTRGYPAQGSKCHFRRHQTGTCSGKRSWGWVTHWSLHELRLQVELISPRYMWDNTESFKLLDAFETLPCILKEKKFKKMMVPWFCQFLFVCFFEETHLTLFHLYINLFIGFLGRRQTLLSCCLLNYTL